MKKQILTILKDINPEVDFENEINIIENGLLDSLDLIRLVSQIEDVFTISLDGSDIIPDNFKSLNEMELLVLKYKV
jgi:acyl carrier protein